MVGAVPLDEGGGLLQVVPLQLQRGPALSRAQGQFGRAGEIVRGWLIIGALALLGAWLLGSVILVAVGLSAIGVGMTWWAVPAGTDHRPFQDDKIP